MARISQQTMVQAITKVHALNRHQKEALAAELFAQQPNLLGAVLVLAKLGVKLEKIEFLLDLLFVSWQAMKESGLSWPLITEDDLDRESRRFSAIAGFGHGLSQALQDRSRQEYIEAHPEKQLLAYVQVETAKWLDHIVPEESDKYILLATWQIVNCIAFVPVVAGANPVAGVQ